MTFSCQRFHFLHLKYFQLNSVSVVDDGLETFVVDDRNGLLVLHPDHLLSGTSIVSSLFCTRKAVLNERFKGLEGLCLFIKQPMYDNRI